MARGGGNGAGEKNEKWGSEEQNEKEEKRGKEKEEKDVAEIGAPHHKKQD